MFTHSLPITGVLSLFLNQLKKRAIKLTSNMQGITRIPEFDQKTVQDTGNVKWVRVWLLPAKRDSPKFEHGYGIWKENDIKDSDDISSGCGIPVKGAGTRDQDIPFPILYHNYKKWSSKGDNKDFIIARHSLRRHAGLLVISSGVNPCRRIAFFPLSLPSLYKANGRLCQEDPEMLLFSQDDLRQQDSHKDAFTARNVSVYSPHMLLMQRLLQLRYKQQQRVPHQSLIIHCCPTHVVVLYWRSLDLQDT